MSDYVYIFDMYNSNIYPNDTYAKEKINKKVELENDTTDKDYLKLLDRWEKKNIKLIFFSKFS